MTTMSLSKVQKTKQCAMTRGELLNLLTEEAKIYREKALSSIERNRRMNNLSLKDISKMKKDQQWAQRLADALLVDFINIIGVSQCIDYCLRTKHIKPKSGNST